MAWRRLALKALAGLAGALLALPMGLGAAPITPTRDDEIIETLPAVIGSRNEARRLRAQLAAHPADVNLALAEARRNLAQARQTGDPRPAGLALATLAPWPDAATAPVEVVLLRATLQQYLHQFDLAVATLRQLLARPAGAAMAQAWLTLATVLRVQGAYVQSNLACERVAEAGAVLHAQACRAENAALTGDVAGARKRLSGLMSEPRLTAETRAWLLTTLAELEARDGRARSAEDAFRAALRLAPDAYTALDYADFLLDQGQPKKALQLLKGEPRTDAVLLRLAMAGTRVGGKEAAADVAEMRERIALANERPEARRLHGREQAMFALAVDQAPTRALSLARGNVELQREPIDLLVLARAARASGDAGALVEATRLKARLGLHDKRIDALL
jgi:tetratricopeptide (TPR) repeat protein